MKKVIFVLIVMCVYVINAQAQRHIEADQPGVITAQPVASASVCESNGIITIGLTATGTSLTYQYQAFIGGIWTNCVNDAIHSNVTTATMTLTNAPASYNGRQYRCIVTSTGTCGNTTTSVSATVTLDLNPAITIQPLPVIVCAGLPTSFSVTATGAGLTYQWQEDGINLFDAGVYSNVTTSTLNISDVTGLGGKQYRCVVTGTCGTPATSNTALLTVNALIAITTQPVAPAAVCSGAGTQTFTIVVSGTNPTYQWQENNGGGFANITNGGVYSGATSATLTLTNPTSAMNGYTYQCVVTGTCSAATSNIITNTINPQATITIAPTAQQVCASGSLYLNTAAFSVTAAGASTYQWEYNSGSGWSNATGAYYTNETTPTLTVTNPISAMNGYQYRCHLTTALGCSATYTTPVAMTVNALPTSPTWLIASSSADTVHFCITAGSVNMTLNPTQGANVSYQLQYWPSLAPAIAPVTGNNGIRTVTGITAGDYVWEILNTTTGCAIQKLN